jgi:hypothetical protein
VTTDGTLLYNDRARMGGGVEGEAGPPVPAP